MATRPTKRILDWASGGTATDPGGAQEAAGWEPDDRPPAYWQNWITQSFGDWLAYFADVVPLAVLRIDVTNPAAVAVDWSVGRALTSVTLQSSDLDIEILFAADICTATDSTVVHVSSNMANDPDVKVLATTSALDEIILRYYESGSNEAWGAAGNTGQVHVTIWGDSP